MVSLHDLIGRSQSLLNLSTGLVSLDEKLFTGHGVPFGILDFQSAPATDGMYHVIIQLIISHLSFHSDNHIIIVEGLLPFPWSLVDQHPAFEHCALDSRISVFSITSFAQLFALFAYDAFASHGTPLVIINNYHELLELYRLEMFATYEESLLRHHIDRNDIFLNNPAQLEATGSTTRIPELPVDSDLIRSSPLAKYEAHVQQLVQCIHHYCQNHLLLCVLAGGADTRFCRFPERSPSLEQTPSPVTQSARPQGGRMVLTPFIGISDASRVDSYIKTRLLFYRAWSPQCAIARSPDHTIPKLVFAVKVFDVARKVVNTQYFDYSASRSVHFWCGIDNMENTQSFDSHNCGSGNSSEIYDTSTQMNGLTLAPTNSDVSAANTQCS